MCLWKFAPASRGFEGFQRFFKTPRMLHFNFFDTLDNMFFVFGNFFFCSRLPFLGFHLRVSFFFFSFFFHSSSFFLSFHHGFNNSKFVQNKWKIQKDNLGKRKVTKALLIFNSLRNKLFSLSIYVWSKWTFKVRNVGQVHGYERKDK